MITLMDKLYESLLDDEEDLINDDSGLIKDIINNLSGMGIPVTDKISKNNIGVKIVKNKLYCKMFIISKRGDYKLSKVFPNFLHYEQLDNVELYQGSVYNVEDLDDPSQYRYLPPVIKKLTLGFVKNENATKLDFTKLNNISNLTDLKLVFQLRIATPLDLPHLPTKKLDTLEIFAGTVMSDNVKVNIDSISGITCDTLILPEFTNKNGDKCLYAPSPQVIDFTYEHRGDALTSITNLFERNNINKLIIRKTLNVGYEVVYNGPGFKNKFNLYKLEKIKLKN